MARHVDSLSHGARSRVERHQHLDLQMLLNIQHVSICGIAIQIVYDSLIFDNSQWLYRNYASCFATPWLPDSIANHVPRGCPNTDGTSLDCCSDNVNSQIAVVGTASNDASTTPTSSSLVGWKNLSVMNHSSVLLHKLCSDLARLQGLRMI